MRLTSAFARPSDGRAARGRSAAAIWALAAVLLPSQAAGLASYLVVDVPTDLGGATYATSDIVRSEDGAYSLEASLPGGVVPAALHRASDDTWLFAPASAVTVAEVTYETRDVVSLADGELALFLDGSEKGLPRSARIDALFLDGEGWPVLSFDTPVDLEGSTVRPFDLVRFEGEFAPFWSGGEEGVPPSSDVIGADLGEGGGVVVTFDVPTIVGESAFLPGDLVRFDASGIQLLFSDASWPLGSQVRGISLARVEPTVTPTAEETDTATPTWSPTLPPTSTPTPSPTATPTWSPTLPPTSTPILSPTPPPTDTPPAATATATRTPAACPGDCNGDGEVRIDELITGVNIALGPIALDQCPAFDTSGNGGVEINELILAVGNALNGCA